jgi:serine/threonine protein kinase
MLGKGAFGKVSLALHKLAKRLVAIKALNKQLLDDASRKKVLNEVTILSQIRHDNIVKLYETMELGKHVLMVMEMCAGGDLLGYVRKRKRLDEPTAKLMFKQIVDGLDYLHRHNVIHRDIKLDNILLHANG